MGHGLGRSKEVILFLRAFSICAMAEIRVWGLRPDSTNPEGKLGQLWQRCAPCAVACPPASQPDIDQRPDFRLFPLLCAFVFSIVSHCSCAGGISLAGARPCIVIAVNFPL